MMKCQYRASNFWDGLLVSKFKDYLEETGIPCLHLEDDYSLSSIGGLKTRVQAFLEMIG